MVRYRLRGAFRVAQHLARYDEIGDAVTEADLDELRRGARPPSRQLARRARRSSSSSCSPIAARGRYDDVLLPFFHRRNLRAQLLNGPADSAMARHNPIQRFGSPCPETVVKAAVYHGPGDIRIEDVPEPEPGRRTSC